MTKIYTLFLALSAGAPILANAHGGLADVYERIGTDSEDYAIGYRSLKLVTIPLHKAPTTVLPRDENCRLDAKQDLGFAKIQRTVKLGRYQIVQPAALLNTVSGEVLRLSSGEIVEDLTSYGEGICEVRARGQIFKSDCLSYSIAGHITIQEREQQSWYFVSCKNTTGWIEASELESTTGVEAYRLLEDQ